jgi:hypothetical protein
MGCTANLDRCSRQNDGRESPTVDILDHSNDESGNTDTEKGTVDAEEGAAEASFAARDASTGTADIHRIAGQSRLLAGARLTHGRGPHRHLAGGQGPRVGNDATSGGPGDVSSSIAVTPPPPLSRFVNAPA